MTDPKDTTENVRVATLIGAALEILERDRVDSLDSGWTQVPKGTVNMVADALATAVNALLSEPASEEPL